MGELPEIRIDALPGQISGTWMFTPTRGGSAKYVPVPGCWVDYGIARNDTGPYCYTLRVELGASLRTTRALYINFGAVSYAATVSVNGKPAGEHLGAWDSFNIAVPSTLKLDERWPEFLDIEIVVTGAGGEEYPTDRILAGFLPYVSGWLFSGLWQDVWLLEALPAQHAAAEPRATVSGSKILLDGKPYYPRYALSWGWYPGYNCPNPPDDVVRSEIANLIALGYNGVKCCLWIPTQRYVELCEEAGLTVWIELPLWLPKLIESDWHHATSEIRAIVKQLRKHSCIILWTIGCELSGSCPAPVLKYLYELVRDLTGSRLVRDNSGGGECYGGLLKEYADYYDYHLYCDLQFLRPTFDYFQAGWRTARPWLSGEFCDADACRNIELLRQTNGELLPWWTSDDQAINPTGVRWDMNAAGAPGRIQPLILRWQELLEGQRKQTLLHRKHTLEFVRGYGEMSGYVVTGLYDTPISIAGMLDDAREPRYTRSEFSRFNADRVLLLSWPRRRRWQAGGDRPSYEDVHVHVSGSTIYPYLGLSNYGNAYHAASGDISLLDACGNSVIHQHVDLLDQYIGSGDVVQLIQLELKLPEATEMRKFQLCIQMTGDDGDEISNDWSLWIAPETNRDSLPAHRVVDPLGIFNGADGATLLSEDERADVIVASSATSEVAAHLEAGGRAFVYIGPNDSIPVVKLPFWREAMKLLEPHVIWDKFIHEGFTDLQFYGLATDVAIRPDEMRKRWPGAVINPVLRRIDARSYEETWYLVDVQTEGGGRMLLTTLRPHGGLGDQHDGLIRGATGWQFLNAALHGLIG